MTISRGIFPYIAHYATFQYVYSFTKSEAVCEEQNLVVPLEPGYDQKNFIPEEIRSKPKKALRWLLKAGYTPTLKDKVITFLPPVAKEASLKKVAPNPQSLLKACEQSITQLKELIIEAEHLQDKVTCPITLKLFENPYMDDHGHNFEKEKIDEIRNQNRPCPLSNEPIISLNPNLGIKEAADEVRQKMEKARGDFPFPVPADTLVDEEKAKTFIKMGKELLDLGQEDVALPLFKKGFSYTNRSQDYAFIPELFERQKAPLKAALAYLYLAKCSLRENNRDAAKEACVKAQQAGSKTAGALFLKKMLTTFDDTVEDPQQAARFFLEQAKAHPEEARHYLEKALISDPTLTEAYDALFPLCDEKRKLHLCLLASIYLTPIDLSTANRFYATAGVIDPNYLLARLALLGRFKKDQGTFKAIENKKIADIYVKMKNFQGAHVHFRKIEKVKTSWDDSYFSQYIETLLLLREPQKAEQVYLTWSGNTKTPVVILEEAIKRIGRTTELLERLFAVHLSQRDAKEVQKAALALGDHYAHLQNPVEEEKTYRMALEKFKDLELATKLEELLRKQNKVWECFQLYSQLAQDAYFTEQDSTVELYFKRIHQLRTLHPHLNEEQKRIFFESVKGWFLSKREELRPPAPALSNSLQSIFEQARAKEPSKGESMTVPSASATWSTDKPTFKGHTRSVTCLLNYSPEIFLSGSWDNSIKIWQPAKSKSPIKSFIGHAKQIIFLGKLPDGTIVSACGDGFIKSWDPVNYDCIHTLRVGEGQLHGVAVLSDGNLCIVTLNAGIGVVNPKTGQYIDSIGQRYSRAIATFDDGRIVHAFGKIVQLDPKEKILNFENPSQVNLLVTHSSGKFASASEDNVIRVWKSSSPQCLATMKGHGLPIVALVFLTSERLVSASEDRTVRIWDVSTGKLLQTIETDPCTMYSLGVLANGVLLGGSNDGSIKCLAIEEKTT